MVICQHSWQQAAREGDCAALLLHALSGVPVDMPCLMPGSSLNGCTALHIAALYGHLDAVTLLVNSGGADVNAVVAGTRPSSPFVYSGFSPLQMAAKFGHADIVAALADRGAALEYTGPQLLTALYQAALNGKALVVEQLLQRGARALTSPLAPSDGAASAPLQLTVPVQPHAEQGQGLQALLAPMQAPPAEGMHPGAWLRMWRCFKRRRRRPPRAPPWRMATWPLSSC